MELFRLSQALYADDLSGKGAAIKGARWNSVGVELIYTAPNRSLCMAEVAVHFSLATLPPNYKMLTIHVPDSVSITRMRIEDLPDNWNGFPYSKATQSVGDSFVREAKFCLLEVPSAVTKGDYNVLINPAHREAAKVRIVASEDFPFDKRIFK